MIAQHHNEIKSLRDVTIQMLDKYVLSEDITVYQRCKYVVEENERLLKACKDLEAGNINSFGKRMFEAHYGVSKLYEVSCPELDFLVTSVQDNPDVLGSRMMGGGFGGCTINIVEETKLYEMIETVSKKYQQAMKQELTPIIVNIEDGTSITRKPMQATI